MIEKFCNYLVSKMKKNNSEISDEKAEIINYGLQLIIGEFPKFFIIFGIAYILGIFKLTIIVFFAIQAYRACSGGFHAKTHTGCILATLILYCVPAYLSKIIVFPNNLIKYLVVLAIWTFGMVMVKLYAPADTENVPILRAKDRKIKKILSYITLTSTLVVAVFIKNTILSNLLIFGCLIQTLMIIKLTYKLTKNKYGYAEFIKQNPLKA